MTKMFDRIVGELTFNYLWWRPESVVVFGEKRPIRLSFSGDEDQKLDQVQCEAFAAFWSSRDRLLAEAEKAILDHYLSIREEVRARVSEDVVDAIAPAVNTINDLRSIVHVTALFFPYGFNPEPRVVGLLADCSWDPSLGLAVKFEDERIVEVGPQDIVL